jgi:nitrous oxide reductase
MKRTKHAASSTKAEDTSHRRNRRQALALGGAAAAAAAVAALAMDGGKKAQAATGQSMIVGHGNQSDPGDWTGLSGNVGGNVPGEVAVLDITNLSHERGDGLHVRARGGFQA